MYVVDDVCRVLIHVWIVCSMRCCDVVSVVDTYNVNVVICGDDDVVAIVMIDVVNVFIVHTDVVVVLMLFMMVCDSVIAIYVDNVRVCVADVVCVVSCDVSVCYCVCDDDDDVAIGCSC